MSVPLTCVLAVDPGLLTGACRWFAGAGLEHGFELPHLDFCDWAWAALAAHPGPGTVVVCESFQINAATSKKSPQPWSIEVIGFLRWAARYHGCGFDLQSASDAKTFVNNVRLRSSNCWFMSLPHARDAARHLLLYMARAGWYDGTSLKGTA